MNYLQTKIHLIINILGVSLLALSSILAPARASHATTRAVGQLEPASNVDKFHLNASSNYIVINANGFAPATLVIKVGETVTWHNAISQTHRLKSGVPDPSGGLTQIFLPFITKGSGNATASDAATQAGEASTLAGDGDFDQSLPPGADFSSTFTAVGTFPFYLATADQFIGRIIVEETGATTIVSTSPADGEGDVAVTRETIIEFDAPIAADGVTAANFYARFGGQSLGARLQHSADRRGVTLFYNDPLPASARVQVTINGDGIQDASGQKVDADGDGQPGGVTQISFNTLSLTVVPGTSVCGRVYASELQKADVAGVSVNNPLQGATITVDGKENTLRTTHRCQRRLLSRPGACRPLLRPP
jgi:plastocyanin